VASCEAVGWTHWLHVSNINNSVAAAPLLAASGAVHPPCLETTLETGHVRVQKRGPLCSLMFHACLTCSEGKGDALRVCGWVCYVLLLCLPVLLQISEIQWQIPW
jgi:hypothetical protein